MNEAAEIIYDLVDPNALIIFGAVVDNQSEWLAPGEVAITIIATGARNRRILRRRTLLPSRPCPSSLNHLSAYFLDHFLVRSAHPLHAPACGGARLLVCLRRCG